jgi:hypothetical protein
MTPGVLSAATRFFFNFVGHADSWAMTCLLFLPAAVIYFEAVAYLLAALARAERQPQPE